ncbi:hypothetical protein [Rhizobium sp. Root1220]|nr:hypothetical protein [Rhizobium sp. Root1220]
MRRSQIRGNQCVVVIDASGCQKRALTDYAVNCALTKSYRQKSAL